MVICNLCRIREISRDIAAFELEFEKRFDICFNEGVMLCELQQCETKTSGELADCLGLTLSNTSKVIAQIEKKGLVKRSPCKSDKRVMRCRLTPKGKEKIEEIQSRGLDFSPPLKRLLEMSYDIDICGEEGE